MALEDEKKKPASLGQQAQDAYGASADRTERSGEQLAGTVQSAGEQQINDINAAEQERVKATGSAMERYRQQVDQGITDFAAIVEGEKERSRRAEQEARQQVQGDRKAAQLTGVTEALASIVNLIGVGGHGASNQVYHSYSQDWMRKADDNLREHRNRIDNMRDRQQALQERLIQLRSGDAEQALQYAMREAEAARGHATTIAGLRANTALDAAKIRNESIDRAEALRLQGTMQGLQFDQREREIARQDALQRKQMDNQMLMRGYVPDGEGGYKFDAATAGARLGMQSSGRSASSSASGSGDDYRMSIGGNKYVVRMSKETFRQNINRSREELKKDIMALTGFDGTWEEFKEAAENAKIRRDGKKVDNPLFKYQDHIMALDSPGELSDEDYNIIKGFVDSNKDSVDNFNNSLLELSNGTRDFGLVSIPESRPGDGVMLSDAEDIIATL